MTWPFRVTPPLLDVVEVLVATEGKIHGQALADELGEGGPNVYRALERLRSAGWIDDEWEPRNPEHRAPPRRLCWLTPEGRIQAAALLEDKAPLRRQPPPGSANGAGAGPRTDGRPSGSVR